MGNTLIKVRNIKRPFLNFVSAYYKGQLYLKNFDNEAMNPNSSEFILMDD